MIITDEKRKRLTNEKPAIEILCYEECTVLIVGNELHQFTESFTLDVKKCNDRTLTLKMDVDTYAKEFLNCERHEHGVASSLDEATQVN